LVVAFGGDFWALRGFRPFDQISDLLGSHPELAKLAASFAPSSSGLKNLYETFMTDSSGKCGGHIKAFD
jgi:mannose-6-phosphate isomerase class I